MSVEGIVIGSLWELIHISDRKILLNVLKCKYTKFQLDSVDYKTLFYCSNIYMDGLPVP